MEGNTEVWFDDLKITHERSVIVAGADYYPFGLPMENREITREDYRYGYQGQYAEKDKTTGWNEFELRFYDAKIGRWLGSDPYGQYHSPYMAMGNTPHMSVDANGGWSWITAGIGFGVGAIAGYAITGDWKGALIGGVAGGFIGGIMFDPVTQGYDKGTRSATREFLGVQPSKFARSLGKINPFKEINVGFRNDFYIKYVKPLQEAAKDFDDDIRDGPLKFVKVFEKMAKPDINDKNGNRLRPTKMIWNPQHLDKTGLPVGGVSPGGFFKVNETKEGEAEYGNPGYIKRNGVPRPIEIRFPSNKYKWPSFSVKFTIYFQRVHGG